MLFNYFCIYFIDSTPCSDSSGAGGCCQSQNGRPPPSRSSSSFLHLPPSHNVHTMKQKMNVHLPVETGTVLFLHLDGNGKIVPLLWRLLSQKSLNPWIKKGLWNGAREPIHSNPKRRVFLLQSLPKGCPRAQRGHGSSGE